MERRGFLTVLGAALTGAVLDPERLLWVPGQKVFVFLPKAPLVQLSVHPRAQWVTQAVATYWLAACTDATASLAEVNRRYDHAYAEGSRLRKRSSSAQSPCETRTYFPDSSIASKRLRAAWASRSS